MIIKTYVIFCEPFQYDTSQGVDITHFEKEIDRDAHFEAMLSEYRGSNTEPYKETQLGSYYNNAICFIAPNGKWSYHLSKGVKEIKNEINELILKRNKLI